MLQAYRHAACGMVCRAPNLHIMGGVATTKLSPLNVTIMVYTFVLLLYKQ
jgi:hypothetical protein